MKKTHYILYTLAVLALLGSCSQTLEPPASREGSVILSVSTGASGGAPASVRTILPENMWPAFSRYRLVFSNAESADITIDDPDGLTGDGYRRELAEGTWTVTAEAYRTFTPTGETEQEYLAARGSKSLTVAPGAVTEETVKLEPVPVADNAPKGIFTYTVRFPEGASGTLTLGTNAPENLTSAGTVSLELDPGYYDLFITLTKGNLSAGDSEKVHIYSGLESKYEFEFTGDDFTALVYLTGTITLPSVVVWGDISGGTITAYSDEDHTVPITTSPAEIQAASTWLMGIPPSCIGNPVYLVVEARGRNGKLYTGTGAVTSTEAGVKNIILEDTTPPVVPGFSAVPGNKRVFLNWENPNKDLDYIEISWAGGAGGNETLNGKASSRIITGLANGTEYTFTITAVDTAGNSSPINNNATATPFGGDTLTGLSTIRSYLSSASGGGTPENPVPLPLPNTFSLTAANWAGLLNAIEGKYVALDLSACTAGSHSTGGGLYVDNTFEPRILSYGKSFLVSLVLPDAATSIEAGTYSYPVFEYFPNLKQAGGEGIITIGNSAFYNCSALTEASFPAAESIGGSAFLNCSALTEVSFPAAESISGSAFSNCSALTEASFPAATDIGYLAFEDCSALTELSFSATLTSVYYNPFMGCSSLSNITVDPANPNYMALDGMFLTKDGLTLIAYPTAAGTVTLPEITTIGHSAFYRCSALTEASFPAATDIGYYAFSGCSALTEASFPAATDIGDSAFSGCSALTETSFPAATDIGYQAFADCSALTEASFPAAESIGGSAFYQCSALTEASFPAATSIGSEAFRNTRTTTLTLGNAAPTLGIRMFYGRTGPITVKVPSGATGYAPGGTTFPAIYNRDNENYVCWGNGFRGRGWNGFSFISTNTSDFNSYITLTIEYDE